MITPIARASFRPSRLHRALHVFGDLLGAMGLVLAVPLAILAIGMPVALVVRLVLWIVAKL